MFQMVSVPYKRLLSGEKFHSFAGYTDNFSLTYADYRIYAVPLRNLTGCGTHVKLNQFYTKELTFL